MPKYKPGDILYSPPGDPRYQDDLEEWFFILEIKNTIYAFITVNREISPSQGYPDFACFGTTKFSTKFIDGLTEIIKLTESDVPEEVLKLYKAKKLSIILEK